MESRSRLIREGGSGAEMSPLYQVGPVGSWQSGCQPEGALGRRGVERGVVVKDQGRVGQDSGEDEHCRFGALVTRPLVSWGCRLIARTTYTRTKHC